MVQQNSPRGRPENEPIDPVGPDAFSSQDQLAAGGPEELESDEDLARRERIEAGLEELRARVAEAQAALQTLAGDVIAAGKETAQSIEDTVRRSIERQPYTALTLAALVGFVLGSINSRDRR
jgi:ElaB/YqjD/DUF883 family membrane-anchored ribosome-binding protein